MVSAGAAMPLPALATLALDSRLAGLEFMVAIPASLGGAVKMNAGAHGAEIADVLDEISIFRLDEPGTETVRAAEAGFAYRTSALPHRRHRPPC
jgi:UDP-N-acetylmuramate dehydrogenase